MISPLLMNVALHGLEEAAGVRYRPRHGRADVAVALRAVESVLRRELD